MNYRSPKGHALLDRRLYLPESWANDAERREEAGVPHAAVFRTKPELALATVEDAAAAGGTVERRAGLPGGQRGMRLDGCETRGWVDWHQHTALSKLSLWFLSLQKAAVREETPQMSVPEVRAVLRTLFDQRRWDEEEIVF